MSRTAIARLACDFPGCTAFCDVSGSLHDLGSGRAPLPDGWRISTERIAQVVACQKHAPELVSFEAARHAWEGAECAARNVWIKANPPPKAPSWLARIMP